MSPQPLRSSSRRRRGRAARSGPSAWYAAPALVFFGLFALVPLIGVFILSFMTWDGLGALSYAGTSNWTRTLGNATTQHAIVLTITVTALCWIIQTPISLLLGVFMAGRQRYRAVLSVLYFLPLLFSATAVGIAFAALLDPNFGISRAFGLDILSQDFLGSPRLALPTIMFVIAWCFVPFHSLLYQGAARQIPVSIYEAAMIDGATHAQTFWTIIMPLVRPVLAVVGLLSFISSLGDFVIAKVVLQQPSEFTLAVGMYMWASDSRTAPWGIFAAGAVIAAIPVILLFQYLQKYIVSGLTSGAVKE